MNTMNRSYQLFKKILVFNGSVLFAMTLQRLVLYLVVVRHWLFGAESPEVIQSFAVGIRFDLCVLGFMNIPVLFLMWWVCSNMMTKTDNKVFVFIRRWSLWIYFGVTTLVIHLLAMLDLMYFASNGHRWTYYDWEKSGLDFFFTTVQRWGALFTGGIIAFFLLLWVFRSLFVLFRIQMHTTDSASEKKSLAIEVLRGIVAPVFLVALAARGTLTAHHLGMEHSEVSHVQALNELALSPVWAFDKKF
jgi:hypothetical protein